MNENGCCARIENSQSISAFDFTNKRTTKKGGGEESNTLNLVYVVQKPGFC